MTARNLPSMDLDRADVSLDATASALAMDESSFRLLYDRTARGVWAYLRRLTGSPEMADDLLQETYYRFLRAQSVYENAGHERNALYRIATNLARDAYRRRRPVAPLDEAGVDALPSVASGEERFAVKEDLSRAMAQLTVRERALLWLAYGQGLSHREVAGALGLRVSSVKSLLSRARQRLSGIVPSLAARGGRR